MENDNWKYLLTFEQKEVGEKEKGVFGREIIYPRGIKRHYFDTLNDAFNELLAVRLDYFAPRTKDTYWERYQITRATITERQGKGKAETLLTTQLTDNTGVTDMISLPGLYYHFPKGLPGFEEKACVDLSDFKGYNKDKPYLLTAYAVNDIENPLKPTLALQNRYKEIKAYRNSYSSPPWSHSLDLKSRQFNQEPLPGRDVEPVLYCDIYHFQKYQDAVDALLKIDMNLLDEFVAWERDASKYYTAANVRTNDRKIYSLHLTNQFGDVDNITIFEQAAVLLVDSYLNRVPDATDILPHPQHANIDKDRIKIVARYGKDKRCIEAVPELKRYLDLSENENLKKTVKRKRTVSKQPNKGRRK